MQPNPTVSIKASLKCNQEVWQWLLFLAGWCRQEPGSGTEAAHFMKAKNAETEMA
jgi:hypothetical protein